MRDGQEGLGDIERVRELFLRPKAVNVAELMTGRLDEEGARVMLASEYRFVVDRLEDRPAKNRGESV